MLLFLKSGSKKSQIAAAASLYAPLSVDASMQKGVGAPTFTRASVASVSDDLFVARQAKSGEIRIQRGRRVENLMANSEFPASVSSNLTVAQGVSSLQYNDGGRNLTVSMCRLTCINGLQDHRVDLTPLSTTQNAVISLLVDANGISNRVFVVHVTGSFGTADLVVTFTSAIEIASVVGLPGGWIYYYRSLGNYQAIFYVRIPSPNTVSSWALSVGGLTFNGNGQYIDVSRCMLEQYDGAAPSEYVSYTGANSPQYNGPFVDGVKYFPYSNGNSTNGNVLTEATAGGITSQFGFLSERNSTNLFLFSNDFSNAIWTKGLGLSAVKTGDPGTDGTTLNTCRLTCDGVNLSYISQTTMFTLGQTVTMKMVAKAANSSTLFFERNDGGLASCQFNLSTGIATSGGGIVATMKPFGNGFFECSGTYTGTNATWLFCTVYVDVYGVGGAGKYIVGESAQIENIDFSTSNILSGGSAGSRSSDILTYPISGNISASAGSVSLQFTPTIAMLASALNFRLWGSLIDSNNYTLLYYNAGFLNFVIVVAGVSTSLTIAYSPTVNVLCKVGLSWGAPGMAICVNGGAPVTNVVTDPLQLSAVMQVGGLQVTSQNAMSIMRNLYCWPSRLPDNSLQIITQ